LQYRVISSQIVSSAVNPNHSYIIAVGTSADRGSGKRIWLLTEVISAMNAGDQFFVQLPNGEQVNFETFTCDTCWLEHIRVSGNIPLESAMNAIEKCILA
jgi:hypothetical protein